MPTRDRLTDLYAIVGAPKPAPWLPGGEFDPDVELLRDLIQVLVDNGKADDATTGGVALAVDVWIANELRRAGIDPGIVWPRATTPRTLPQGLSRFAFQPHKVNAKTAAIQRQLFAKVEAATGSSRTVIVGGQFSKEVDVVIADWDRGLEFAVSTKAMTGSYGNNVTNRWEEASGDLLNIRRRFPLVAFGFALLVTTPITTKGDTFARVKDMLRKLTTVANSAEGTAYDAACLIVVDWNKANGTPATLAQQFVPDDLTPARFFERMLPAMFSRSPVMDHADARELWKASAPAGIVF